MQIRFKNDGKDFSALSAAERWCVTNGYSFGPLQHNEPIGIMRGAVMISKWRGLGGDVSALDGRIESGDFRGGDCTIVLKGDA